MKTFTHIFLLFFSLCYLTGFAQVNVNVNLNVKHAVGSFDQFDRSKFIVIHANTTENEWNGDNFTSDLRDDFLNGYDVYLGRDTGGITWNVNQIQEDPTRAGFADPAEIASRGLTARNNFENNTALHPYENRKLHNVVAAQLHPFWTGESQIETKQGWKFANPTATGEYMGRYFNEFHGQNGQKLPTYVEVINEPAYEALGGKMDYLNSIQEIADFHVEVADAIREQDPTLKIGGYTTAFPDFEVGDFQRWNNRWKLFMDVAGEKMDFWSIHLYDFGSIRGGEKELRSGSNVEATFDMMEHYSQLSFNEVKPFVISEYGAQTHDYNNQTWSSYRDWLHIKASNSQLMSFLERPGTIASAINFLIVKAEWGYNYDKDVPYPSRLMRKANEPDSYTGQWVYTDMVKFFQLWQNVNGTRVDSTTDDLDIQVDAYVDGSKAYVILNNLNFEPTTVNLNIFDKDFVKVNSVLKRHLTLSGQTTVLDEDTSTTPIASVVLGAESTIILEYTFENAINVNESLNETKYYANTYLKPITANTEQTFTINNVVKTTYGEAVLRVGLGREHGKSLKPTIKFNNTVINVPEDYRGYDQAQRERFFGVLEIPIDYDLLQGENTISVSFNDGGGHISSVAMQVFNFSSNIREVNPSVFPSNNYQIKATGETCPDSDNGIIQIETVFEHDYKLLVEGENFNENYSFNNLHKIEDLKGGVYTLTFSIPEFPEYSEQFVVEIDEPEGIQVSSKVDKKSNKVNLKLSGGKTYFITINNKTISTSKSEVTLPLDFGRNKIEVVTEKDCLGVYSELILMEKAILAYPNPAENNVSILVPREMIGGTISIYGISGTIIKSEKIAEANIQINIHDLPSGMYYAAAQKENEETLNTKVIIK